MTRYFLYACWICLLTLTMYLTWALMLGWVGPSAYRVDEVAGQQFLTTQKGVIRFQTQNISERVDAVVLLHGFNGSLNSWSALWPLISECGPSVRLDLPGFGQSFWQSEDYSLARQSRDLMQFVDALDLDRVTLVGTSMGASLAAWAAAHYPNRVGALILIAPSGYPGSMSIKGFEKLLYQNIFAHKLARYTAQSAVFNYFFGNSRLLQALTVTRSYNAQWLAALARIHQPTWVVWSQTDRRVPFQYGERIVGLVPSAQLVTAIDAAGHDIPNRDPYPIAKLLCDLQNQRTAKDDTRD
ncbi:MAG: alpha/beta fold hydrolase [Reinekea forsetii]|nr:alpha/beta fold hydrolase [Reinekea forsetii]